MGASKSTNKRHEKEKQIIERKAVLEDHSKSVKNRNTINLIYNKKIEDKENEHCNKIFGKKFVENNKDNITLIINGKKSLLIEEYELKNGSNYIQIIINKQLTNLEDMFANSVSLENIEELKYLNTEEIKNFSYMFRGCKSLSDIKPLENWNASNCTDFNSMFYDCSSLSDIKPLEK